MSVQPGELTVSSQTPDIGEARESLPVAFQGEPFEIGFNPEFLRDGLEGVESGDIVLKLISPLRPGLIQAADDPGFLYPIMPTRLTVEGGWGRGRADRAPRDAQLPQLRRRRRRAGPRRD